MPGRRPFIAMCDSVEHILTEPSPVSWILYGKPSAEKLHGKQIAGTPAISIGTVNSALRGAAAPHAWS